MDNCETNEIQLLFIVVNYGLGSKIKRSARKFGILGGTVFLGKGTVKSHLLEFLELNDIRKEIVMMISDKEKIQNALNGLDEEYHFHKPNHGIAFTISACNLLGVTEYKDCKICQDKGDKSNMYKAIFTIVEKGKAEEVMDAANKAGSIGGTIINARGSSIHETKKVFSMEIEPEKEIVLIISKSELTDGISSSIREALKLDEPGNGLIFILDINEVFGLQDR